MENSQESRNESTKSALPIEPGLFSLVHNYAVSLRTGEIKSSDHLDQTTHIYQFCMNFFQQLLQHEFDYRLTSFDEESKKKVVRLRLRLEGDPASASLVDLLLLFERFCDDEPGLTGFAYGESGNELSDFHSDYIPQLLERAEIWASSREFEDIAVAAREAAEAYGPAKRVYGAMVNLQSVDVRALVDMVELDYERAAKFAEGLVQRQAGIRGLTVTVWTAVLGVAFGTDVWGMGLLAGLSTTAFLSLDAYYSSLFTGVQKHIGQLEHIGGLYYRALQHALAGEPAADLLTALSAYRFGFRRGMRKVRPRDLIKVLDRMVFRFFYPSLILVAAAAAVLIAFP